MSAPVYVVLGAGPGLGLATAQRFAATGHAIVLVGRTAEQMEPLVATLRASGASAEGVGATLTDPAAVTALIEGVVERYGRIDVLHFNPSVFREADVLHLTVDELFEDLALGVAPLLPAVQAAVDAMRPGSRVLVTGSMAADKPSPAAPSLGIQKAAVRNLVTSLDATLRARGIRAVAVQINGSLAKEGPFAPPAVSAALHAATQRPDSEWTAHVAYDGQERR
jgi:NAD(P)-dependent dehydrogenase (short-subunit alcohol dehydrogenase family)